MKSRIIGVLAGLIVANSALAAAKVSVCHVPPGNPANAHVLRLPQAAVKAHLAHGDKLGACGDAAGNQGAVVIQPNTGSSRGAVAPSGGGGKTKGNKQKKDQKKDEPPA